MMQKKLFKWEVPKSIRQEAMEDKDFRKKWKQERLYRMLTQKYCLYCGEFFEKAKGGVIHHTKMKQMERRLKDRAKLVEYYKTLQDTDLICVSCHAKEHVGILRGSGQRRLF
jgi:hypothetical protein